MLSTAGVAIVQQQDFLYVRTAFADKVPSLVDVPGQRKN